MNRKMRILAAIMALAMILSMAPQGILSVKAASSVEHIENTSGKGDEFDLLGLGFNALGNSEISSETLTTRNILDYNAMSAVKIKGTRSSSFATYASDAQEMMWEMGIDYTVSADADIPLKIAKAGFENKFQQVSKTSGSSVSQSMFYYYVNEVVTTKYSANVYEYNIGSADILSAEFLTALEYLNSDTSTSNIATFFNNWGTHMLTSYSKGGYLEYYASAYSYSDTEKINETITNNFSANVGAEGKVGVNVAADIAAQFGSQQDTDKVKYSSLWEAHGGSGIGGSFTIDPTTGESLIPAKFDEWTQSFQDDNIVIIPDTTEWIPIWELIPSQYSAVKTALKEYYVLKAATIGTDFFDKYATYSDVTELNKIVYTNAAGYVTMLDYSTNSNLKVSQGSKFNVVSLSADLSNVSFAVQAADSTYATVDEFGFVTVSSSAPNSVTLDIDILNAKGEVITTRSFDIQQEGANGQFAGGYGDAVRPYLISTATHFSNIRNYPSAGTYFRLINNINLGSSVAPIDSFAGTLDGNGYTLSGWSYVQSTVGNIGLFRVNSGTIKNLNISGFAITTSDPDVAGTLNAGLLCGKNSNTIENVTISGSSLRVDVGALSNDNYNYIYTGLLCGYNEKTIKQCGVFGGSTISAYCGSHYQDAHCFVGGIVGYSAGGQITDVYSHDNTISSHAKADHKNPWIGSCTHGRPDSYAGGVIAYANNTTLTRALGYNNAISANAEIVDNCSHTEDEGGGSLIGYRGSCTLSACYSQSADTLIGVGSTTGASKELSSLTASGVINNLSGFASNGWIAGSGGHLEIAQNSRLQIIEGVREYFVGDPLDLTGLKIQIVKANGTVVTTLITTDFQVSGYNANTPGTQTITVTYGKVSGTYTVTVKKPEVVAISVYEEPVKQNYYSCEDYDFDGLSVMARYSDGSIAQVAPAELNTVYGTPAVGENKVTVTYGGQSDAIVMEVVGHDLIAVERKEPTYKVDGNIAYWVCEQCGKLYSDESGENEISIEDTVLKFTGLLGDADGDGYVDAYDASLIKKYSVGAIGKEDLNFSVLDLDGDDYVDAYDASLIQKYSVGAIEKFPVED